MTDVVIDIDIVVIHPDWIRQLEGHQRKLALKDRRDVHPAHNVFLDVFVEIAVVA